jgi:hypothetical protein
MNGIGQMSARPFAFFARIHERNFFSGVQAALNFRAICFADSRSRFIHQP